MNNKKFALDQSLGFQLNRAAWNMRRALETRLATYDITTAQWSIMARIAEEEGLTQGELGRRSLFDRPTVTGIINRLEQRQLISRRKSADSARANAIHLTAAGKTLFAKLPPLANEVNEIAEKEFTAAERRQLIALLQRISTAIDSQISRLSQS